MPIFLVMIVYKRLNFQEHVSYIEEKLCKDIYVLKRLKPFVSKTFFSDIMILMLIHPFCARYYFMDVSQKENLNLFIKCRRKFYELFTAESLTILPMNFLRKVKYCQFMNSIVLD